MGEELTFSERSMLALVARRFFLEDRSKVEIGEELGVSRFKVARIIAQARETGVVKISLEDDGEILPEMSAALATHLGIMEAVVVEARGDAAWLRRSVGIAAADLLRRTLKDGEVLGMAWGRTISTMTENLPSLPKVSVVQLTGTVGNDLAMSPVEVVRKIAERSGGSTSPIFAPMVVDSASNAVAIRQQPDIAQALKMFGSITTAVMAVGSWSPPDSQLLNVLDQDTRDQLLAQQVQGEVAACLIDENGQIVGEDFTDRCIAITADQLRKVPRVILVAAGAQKAMATRAARRAGFATGLVVDRTLAEALLDAPA
jgi:DNA-binding transcriptional regulator LsrR (DeoR family)